MSALIPNLEKMSDKEKLQAMAEIKDIGRQRPRV